MSATKYLAKLKKYHRPSYNHSIRVMYFAKEIAKKEGLALDDQRLLIEAALFHDIGKLKVPIKILDKPGTLTKEEKEIIERHPKVAYEWLIKENPQVAELVITHHEYQKDAYPRKKVRVHTKLGELLALADSYDALRSQRSYKLPISIPVVEKIIEELFSKHDAELVKDVE